MESLEATRRLRSLIPENPSMNCDVQYLVAFGLVPKRIAEAVADCQPDLIVMGVKKVAVPRASAHLHWLTAHQVVCKAKCAVLTICSDRCQEPVETDLPQAFCWESRNPSSDFSMRRTNRDVPRTSYS